jgi:hypothetical protein
MVARLTEKDLGAFSALEPEMRVVIPGESYATVKLNTFGCHAQVSF